MKLSRTNLNNFLSNNTPKHGCHGVQHIPCTEHKVSNNFLINPINISIFQHTKNQRNQFLSICFRSIFQHTKSQCVCEVRLKSF
ncbi:hypothetical protein Hanom_Chr09g00865601 [Helianthus anomalus]